MFLAENVPFLFLTASSVSGAIQLVDSYAAGVLSKQHNALPVRRLTQFV